MRKTPARFRVGVIGGFLACFLFVLRNWRLAAGLVDDGAEEVIRLAAAMGAGGDHAEDGDGDGGIEAGEGIAKRDWIFIVP